MKLDHLAKNFLELDHVEVSALLEQNDADKKAYVNVFEKKATKKVTRSESKKRLSDYAQIVKALSGMSDSDKATLLESLTK